MWVTAAPARAASITALAICSGVIGIDGCLPTVSPAPVTAQVTMTSVFIPLPPRSSGWAILRQHASVFFGSLLSLARAASTFDGVADSVCEGILSLRRVLRGE